MKRKLFIGSSTEGIDIARALKTVVDSNLGAQIETHIWDEGKIFTLNSNALDSLIKATRKYDYGVLVATKDDLVDSRGVLKAAPRDNVILEMGMFLGSLGLTRAFLLIEEEAKLPTDYYGITLPFFDKAKHGSLDNAINVIIEAFKSTLSSYNLKPLPSAALALGYFENFILPAARKKLEESKPFTLEIFLPKSIKSINDDKLLYNSSNPSKEVGLIRPGERPTAMEYNSKPNVFWDIPTTLRTLSNLIDLILPSTEIGINVEKEEWILHELNHFAGTLKVLIDQHPACNGKVHVLRL